MASIPNARIDGGGVLLPNNIGYYIYLYLLFYCGRHLDDDALDVIVVD